MRKIFSALGMIGALLLSGCQGKGKQETASTADGPQKTKVSHADWSRNAVIYEVNLRQYTPEGTVTAFAQELPRLSELGVDILWFMPVNPISVKDRKGTLGSYYAVADYTKFNPEFGTMDEFKKMVSKAHSLGMKVILDWVPNHSGRDNPWIEQHPEWYERDSAGNFQGLYDWTDVYVFDYSNPELRKAMIEAMRFWLREADVDGFRCDVAMEVPTDFWNEARPELEKTKKEIFLLAEASKPELQEEGFDMGYNWPLKELFSEIAATHGEYSFHDSKGAVKEFPAKHAKDIMALIDKQAEEYPRDTYLMNMITNHDLNSWEGTEFERLGILQTAFAVLSFTLPGMPLIYTGQETGMNRPLMFFEKDRPPVWEPRNVYFKFYKTLCALKHREGALAAGEAGGKVVWYPTKNEDVLVFERKKGVSRVVVAANLSNDFPTTEFVDKAPDLKGLLDVFDGTPAVLPETLKPGEVFVFVKVGK